MSFVLTLALSMMLACCARVDTVVNLPPVEEYSVIGAGYIQEENNVKYVKIDSVFYCGTEIFTVSEDAFEPVLIPATEGTLVTVVHFLRANAYTKKGIRFLKGNWNKEQIEAVFYSH